ncbi:hypothetical protein H5410_001060 [Solanum commersonii]|uniref:Uncharacterized protein n=1 Tax=Solanum commersonii TaxID=4109 RepID=A0A9J6AZ32_SOLCO|nr:hypothetical protein H5410_001060 [Solanum commersonii]
MLNSWSQISAIKEDFGPHGTIIQKTGRKTSKNIQESTKIIHQRPKIIQKTGRKTSKKIQESTEKSVNDRDQYVAIYLDSAYFEHIIYVSQYYLFMYLVETF